jgi:hemoglobin-like flavoprotein
MEIALNYEKLFEDSYSRVIGEGIGLGEKGRRFFRHFYTTFFSKSEEVRDKFKDVEMDVQIHVLEKSMFHIISFYVAKTDTEFLQKIAQTHNREQYDIKPKFYDIWLEALIETVEELDPEFNDDLRLAWRLAMTPGIQFMKFHY